MHETSAAGTPAIKKHIELDFEERDDSMPFSKHIIAGKPNNIMVLYRFYSRCSGTSRDVPS